MQDFSQKLSHSITIPPNLERSDLGKWFDGLLHSLLLHMEEREFQKLASELPGPSRYGSMAA